MTVTQVKTEQEAVHEALKAWISCVETKDMTRLPSTVGHDADLVWVGPADSEWLAGWEALEGAMLAQNAALDTIRITVSEETIHLLPGERFAWATNRWVFHGTLGGQAIEMPLRCTWVLEKRASGWVIVHFHKSAGVAR